MEKYEFKYRARNIVGAGDNSTILTVYTFNVPDTLQAP